MSHVRTQLRNYAIGALKGGPVVDGNIHDSKVTPLEKGDHFNVLAPLDAIVNPGKAFSDALSEVDLVVEVSTSVVDGYAAKLDDLCLHVQKNLEGKSFGQDILIEYLASTVMTFSPEGNATHATAEMTFKATYQIDKSDPETAI